MPQTEIKARKRILTGSGAGFRTKRTARDQDESRPPGDIDDGIVFQDQGQDKPSRHINENDGRRREKHVDPSRTSPPSGDLQDPAHPDDEESRKRADHRAPDDFQKGQAEAPVLDEPVVDEPVYRDAEDAAHHAGNDRAEGRLGR